MKAARPSLPQTRRNVATLAARLMAEDGIENYGVAKRKAARQLHLAESEVLPTNAEIESELRTYQSLYQRHEHVERLDSLRQTALRVMRLLRPFAPYLTGHVLDGTAGRYATIDLMLFTDAAKEVELFLLEQGIEYRHMEARRSVADGSEICIECDVDGTPIRIAVLAADEQRLHRRNPYSGRSAERASLSVVEALLAPKP